MAEMKKRTVMNKVRSMLSSKNIPKIFWPEVVNWTFYVLNKCPTLVEHFRIFGYVFWMN